VETCQTFDHTGFRLQTYHERRAKALIDADVQRGQVAPAGGLKSASGSVPVHEKNHAGTVVLRTAATVGLNQVHEDIVNRPSTIQYLNRAGESVPLQRILVTTALNQHSTARLPLTVAGFGQDLSR